MGAPGPNRPWNRWMTERPAHFPPGTYIGDHYAVEGLVRLSEGRMFYLVNDDRPDRPTRKCWNCGFDGAARAARLCPQCGTALSTRRFLMSARWEPEGFEPFQAFASRKFSHPGLVAPVDCVRTEDQLLSFVPYDGEGLMVDEASPLPNQRVLHLTQRLVGTIAWLARQGVKIAPLQRANMLIAADGSVRLYDLDVVDLLSDPLPQADVEALVRELAIMLGSYAHVRSDELAGFYAMARHGDFPTTGTFGRAVESRFDSLAAQAFPSNIGAMTDVGLTRQLNEDNWGWAHLGEELDLYVVADGMGGHDGGEVASAMAVETITRVAREKVPALEQGVDAVEETLNDAFQAANNAVKAEADRKGNDMGTTLVAAMVSGAGQAIVANVGDSRAYLFRDRALHQVSVDHSFVQKLVDRGRISKEEARDHPQSNILLRTVGTEKDVEIDLFRVEVSKGDRLLLCSDGLWGEVEDDDIASILATYADPRVAARELVRAAHQGGGKDNVTLMIVAMR